MDPVRNQLLSRLLAAAKTIADAPTSSLADDGGSSSRSQGRVSDRKPWAAENDVAGVAAQELLRRQAILLIQIHESLFGGGEASRSRSRPHGVDDELLQRRLDDLASIATSKLYAYRYDSVPLFWRCLYSDTLVLSTYRHVLRALSTYGRLGEDVLDLIVETLDRALITTGSPGKELGAAWIEKTLQALEAFCATQDETHERPRKRQRTMAVTPQGTFRDHEPYGRPRLSPGKECPRCEKWTLARFEAYMNRGGPGDNAPRPLVFTDLMDHWPALTDRRWNRPDYLLSRTFGGRRLVPVEVGRSYVDQGWGQELMPFRRFLERYVVDAGADVGYLAQHNLFHQVPPLRNDVAVPDFCWSAVPLHPVDAARNRPRVDAPQLNAWFGPARTITPLHTDGYHNLLCQVVGTKYVRLYPPCATPVMRPRTSSDHGVDMSNTSALDVGVLEGWDEPPDGLGDAELRDLRARLQGVEYYECVLGPGDALLIPIGWWHYVRSLSISFSVSFWWN